MNINKPIYSKVGMSMLLLETIKRSLQRGEKVIWVDVELSNDQIQRKYKE